MADKRMLIIDTDVAKKIDDNRGDLSCSEFLSFLIDSRLEGGTEVTSDFVDRKEFQQLEQGIKDMLRTFLEFFISYGMELGKEPQDKVFAELCQKLQSLSNSSDHSK
ncbi:hypothetical protein ACFLU4_01250 [Chloroflexota bacterium]